MSFDPREATISSVREALTSGNATCRDIVQAFLTRIELLNPKINAIISLNPNALAEADWLDAVLAQGKAPGLLFGVPILLKDNFDAVGMPTTAGSRALRDTWPTRDASTVTALRNEGAIVLGKTNLHEFALEGLTVSSLGGQTLNPYDFSRTPGGSSGGSGAAVAASFAVMATGTDTVNSLRSPASANSLYSFRPTRGLISPTGVVPVSSTQDTVGMIGRSLLDIATAMKVMSDAEHEETEDGSALLIGIEEKTYIQSLTGPASKTLSELRIGILQGFLDNESSPEIEPVKQAMHQVLSMLVTEGTTVVDIKDTVTFNAPTILKTADVQMYEIRGQIDKYLSSSEHDGTPPQDFVSVFHPQHDTINDTNFLVIPVQYPYMDIALKLSPSSPEYAVRKASIARLTQTLHETFRNHNLDAIIYPQQRNLVVPVGAPTQKGRNGILAAVTGSPVVCIPVGFSPSTATAPIGLPIGMEILGMPWTEAKVLQVARMIDEKLYARRPPVTDGIGEGVVVSSKFETVPQIVPKGISNVDQDAYPLGRISIQA